MEHEYNAGLVSIAFVDGSYKDGIIGYGGIIYPDGLRIKGGRSGDSSEEAEKRAVRFAAKKRKRMIIHTDNQAVARYFKFHPIKGIRVVWLKRSNEYMKIAHEEAEKGRADACKAVEGVKNQ